MCLFTSDQIVIMLRSKVLYVAFALELELFHEGLSTCGPLMNIAYASIDLKVIWFNDYHSTVGKGI